MLQLWAACLKLISIIFSLFCRVKKAFKCKCGKSYKTAQKLRSHMITQHPKNELLKQSITASQALSTGTPVHSIQVGYQNRFLVG